MNEWQCPSCGQQRAVTEMKDGRLLPSSLAAILGRTSAWRRDNLVCEHCIQQAKATHLQEMLAGNMSPAGMEVVNSLRHQTLISTNLNAEMAQRLTPAEKIAEGTTNFIGSWYFPAAILLFLFGWISLNILSQPFAPYPTILFAVISSVLGSLAALHGPIILMNQRRLSKQDRLKADNDYRVNLKAELEIQYLNEKIDRLFVLIEDKTDAAHGT